MLSTSLPFPVRTLAQAKLVLAHAMRAYDVCKKLYCPVDLPDDLHRFSYNYIKVWNEFISFESDATKKEGMLKTILKLCEETLAQTNRKAHDDEFRWFIKDYGGYYCELAKLKREFAQNFEAQYEIKTKPIEEKLKQLWDEINDLVFKSIQMFHKNLISFPEINRGQRIFSVTSPITSESIPVYKLPNHVKDEESSKIILKNYCAISYTIFFRIPKSLKERKKFAKQTLDLSDQILAFIKKYPETYGHLEDDSFVTELHAQRMCCQNILEQ